MFWADGTFFGSDNDSSITIFSIETKKNSAEIYVFLKNIEFILIQRNFPQEIKIRRNLKFKLKK